MKKTKSLCVGMGVLAFGLAYGNDFARLDEKPQAIIRLEAQDDGRNSVGGDSASGITRQSNPLLEGWYADPQIRRFGDRYWVLPTYSHDFREQTFVDAFSSKDLKAWTKHSQVLTTNEVKWAKGAMWAPDALEKGGKYYLFFAANDAYPVGGKREDGEPQKEPGLGKYGGIGVAVADRPEGPYRDLIGKPLIDRFWNAAQPIDQYVFKYRGEWYMLYGGWGRCNLVRLADDFKSLKPFEDGRMWKDMTPKDYVEGSVMFERQGKWYFMYSSGNWTDGTYGVNYSMSTNPLGGFEYKGKILSSQSALATGPGHNSVLNIPNTDEWYICYHRHPVPNEGAHHRVVCMDRLSFDDSGNILPVRMTGSSNARRLELGSPFADRMVLQRERSVPIWGWGTPGETVTVEFAGQRKMTKISKSGKWRVDLDSLSACKEERALTVWCIGEGADAANTERISLSDVLVGEVWLCAGQSNCEVPLVGEQVHFRDEQGGMTAQLTRKPSIRYVIASDGDIAHEECEKSGSPLVWRKFVPENLGCGKSFSAIGTHFALQLYDALDIPIGIIGVYNGGTAIEPWIPRQAYAQNEGFESERDWQILGWDEFYKTEGMKAILPEKCRKDQNCAQHQPKAIWNRQLAPLTPFAVRGLVWYQGCSNRCWPERYCKLMHLLCDGWRVAFENPGMPIYFVQLASNEPDTPLIWEQQAQFEREEPRAAMAVANDLGNIHDVHPVRKRPIAVRLAAHALKRDYGFDIQDNSPTLKSWTLDGNKVVLAFHDVKTWYAYNPDWSIRTGFEVAGPDGVFHPARIENMDGGATNAVSYKTSGKIVGRELIVVSDEVREPKSLRYLHQSPWRGILFNEVNLPLAAFKIRVDK